MYPHADPKQSFPHMEESVMKYWQENNTFQKTLDDNAHRDAFVFFDGPPFATGTPHYGHILAGSIKDTILRYHTMQ